MNTKELTTPLPKDSDIFKKSNEKISTLYPLNSLFKSKKTFSIGSQHPLLGPELPVLNEIIHFARQDLSFTPNFKDVIFVCGQHLLTTTISVFETLIALGANPKNIFVVGKN